ncbi:MAG: FAD-dependent oxidoreductase [Acidiferrobacteraceae bacterium]|nr:FAD-dependent oxidoreductase [Acidiferrobacteraceae bacterium]
MAGIIIIGTGHAAVQCAASLRDNGSSSTITLLGGETDLPYHRPPLSKKYAVTGVPEEFSLLRAADFFEKNNIKLRLGKSVEAININQRCVVMGDSEKLSFDQLVIATGSQPRVLSIPGIEHAFSLYSLDDARTLCTRLGCTKTVAVIGGGFIGLEIAAAVAAAGQKVTVVEAAPQILGRSLTPSLAARVRKAHETGGLKFISNTAVDAIRTDGVSTSDGFIEADLVICGAGSVARSELAEKAGLTTGNGIHVNRVLETSATGIYAIGDVACFETSTGERRRYESVQNANDQARALARTLCGERTSYDALPWFWSDQGSIKLQMAGDSCGASKVVAVDGEKAPQTAAFCFNAQDHLCAVETINWPAYHALSRKALSGGRVITRAHLESADYVLKTALKS